MAMAMSMSMSMTMTMTMMISFLSKASFGLYSICWSFSISSANVGAPPLAESLRRAVSTLFACLSN